MGTHLSNLFSENKKTKKDNQGTKINKDDAEIRGKIWENLYNSIVSNDVETCLQLLKSGNVNLNEIHRSVENGPAVFVSRTPNIAPLHLACVFRNAKLIELFCRFGADVNTKDRFARTPINSCVQHWPRIHPTELNVDGWIGLKFMKRVEALHENSAHCLLTLLNYGADPTEVIDCEGRTLLHFCAKKDLYRSFSMLVDAGADLESRDNSGLTPLLYSAKFGSARMVEFIINLSADQNVVDNDGNGILHNICQNENFSFNSFATFAEKPCINLLNKHRQTPLMLLARGGNGVKIEQFLRYGADPAKSDTEGRTALFYLLEHNDPVFCMFGLHSLLVYTPQICIYDNQRRLPEKLGQNNLRHLRSMLEGMSSMPISLYRMCLCIIYKTVCQRSVLSYESFLLNIPKTVSIDLLNFGDEQWNYWQNRLSDLNWR